MKKLMIAAAALTMAVSAFASAADWEFDLNSDWDEYDAYTYFVIQGTDVGAAIDLVSVGDTTGWSSFLSKVNKVSGADIDIGISNGGITGVTSADSLYVVVLEDTGLGDGTEYLYADAKLIGTAAYDPPDSAKGKVAFSGFTSGTISVPGPVPTPEPTSGLLLLLGVAGLALRRKQA